MTTKSHVRVPAPPLTLDEMLSTPDLPQPQAVDRPETHLEQMDAAEQQSKENAKHDIGFLELTNRVIGSGTGVTKIGDWWENSHYKPDPNFSLPDNTVEQMQKQGIPQTWVTEFEHVRSQDEYDAVMRQLRTRAGDEQTVASAGGKGLAANLVGSFADPVGFAVDSAASLAGGAGAVNRIRKIAGAIAAAGASNVAYANLQGDADHSFQRDLVHDFAGGAVFGLLFKGGHMAFSPAEREALAGAYKRAADRATANFGDDTLSAARATGETQTAGEKVADATARLKETLRQPNAPQESYAAPGLDETALNRDARSTLEQRAAENADVQSRFLSARFGEAAKWAKSNYDVVRQMGREFFFDPVERFRNVTDAAGKTVRETVENDAGLIERAEFHNANIAGQWSQDVEHGALKDHFDKAFGPTRGAIERDLNLSGERENVFNDAGMQWRGMQQGNETTSKIVASAQNAIRRALEVAKAAGVKGSEAIEHDNNYVPQVLDPHLDFKFQNLGFKELRDAGEHITQLYEQGLAQARRSAGLEVDQALNRKVAEAFAKRVMRPEARLDHFHAEDGLDYMEDVLTKSGMDQGQIDGIMSHFSGKETPTDKGVASTRFKHRVDLDMKAEVNLPNGRVLRLGDLYDNNVERVVSRYVREMAGHTALAERGFSSWREFQKVIDDLHSENKIDSGMHETARGLLNVTLGRPMHNDPSQTWTKLVRTTKSWNFGRMMGQVMWSMLPDSGSIYANAGMRAAKLQMPTFRRVFNQFADGSVDPQFAREIAAMGAPGTTMLRQTISKRFDPTDLRGADKNKLFKALDKKTAQFQRAVSRMGGMGFGTDWQQIHSSQAMAQRFYDHATGKLELTESDIQRYVDAGMSKKMLNKTLEFVKNNAESDKNGVLTKLNLASMPADVERAVQMMVYRETNRNVLMPGIESLPRFMHTNLGKILGEFRSYTIGAYERKLLHGLARGDVRAGAGWIYGMAIGTLAVLGRTYINYGAGSDKMKELTDDPKKLFAAAFQQSSESSLIPMFVDTAMSDVLQRNPVFDNRGRSSGQQTSFIQGIPTYGLVKSLAETAGMVPVALSPDQQITQHHIQSLGAITGLGTLVGVRRALNAWAGSYPKNKDIQQ